MFIIGLDIDTVCLGFADVGGDAGLQTHGLGDIGTAHEDIFAVFGEELGNDVEFLEQTQFHGVVGLVGGFPRDGFVGVTDYIDSFVRYPAELTEGSLQVRTVHVHLGEIVEAVSGVADVIVTHQAVRGAQLQVVDILVFDLLEPGLVGDYPGAAEGREEAPSVTLVETFGTIVTEVEFGEVALVPAVGETSGQAGVAGRQGELQGAGVGVQLLAGREDQQAGHFVLAEFAGIVEPAFGIHRIGDGLVLLAVLQVIRTVIVDAFYVVLTRVGIIAVQGVPEGGEVAVHLVVRQTCQVEERHELQTRGDETQVLVQLHGCNHLGTLGVAVTSDQVGVRVGIGTVVIVTEHDVLDADVLVVDGIIGGEQHRIGVDHLFKHIVATVERAGIVREITRQAHGQLSGFRNVDIYVGSQGIGLLIDVIVEGVAFVHLQDTGIFREGTCHIVAGDFSAATGRNVGSVRRRKILEQHVVPVVGRIDETVGTGFPGLLNLVEAVL